MSENTETTTEATESAAPFAEILAETNQPEAVTAMMVEKLNSLFDLIVRHNSRVIRIQQAKQQDPNNVEMLDSVWTNLTNAKAAPAEILEAEEKYQAVVDEMLSLKDTLRAWAKTQIKPPLSEEEAAKERAAANEEAKLIESEMVAAESFAKIADSMLEAVGKPIPGGIFDYMPAVESLKPGRGRKSSGSDGMSYRTRLDSVTWDGVPMTKEQTRKGVTSTVSNFMVMADNWNAKFNAEKFPENGISDETLERAMYASAGKEFRDKDGLPEVVEFTFTKTVKQQNANDDSATEIPITAKIVAKRNVTVAGAAAKAKENAESKSDDAPKSDEKSDEKQSDDKPADSTESPKSETTTESDKPGNASVPAPNSKAAAVAARKAQSNPAQSK